MASAPPVIEDFDSQTYDPFLADEANFGTMHDPYPLIARLRAEGPIHAGSYRQHVGLAGSSDDTPSFTLVGSAEVAAALANANNAFSNAAYQPTLGMTFGRSISTMDNPEHGRFRRIFQRIFLPQNVKSWGESIVDPVVDGLLARFLPSGRADLIQDFTIRYPFEVIYKQLDLPERDVRTFQRLALGQTDFQQMATAQEAGRKLGVYFRQMVERRRAAPGDDLISLLATTEVDGEYLPEDVLISFLRQLMNAAGDTTFRGTSVLLTALLENPDQLAALRADRSLIPAAIEEALRWDGPVVAQARMAARDLTIAGVHVPAGAVVDVIAGAANRDPAEFPDPDRFDILRARKAHFSFSRGAHICVGQHLARVEMTRALHAVLDRMHNLRFDPEQPRPQIAGAMMRVPHHLHVLFDPA